MKLLDRAKKLIRDGKALKNKEVVVQEKMVCSGTRTTIEITKGGYIKRKYTISPRWGDDVVVTHYKGNTRYMVEEFNSNKKLFVRDTFNGNETIHESFHDNGRVCLVTPYVGGKKRGIEKEYNKKGTLICTTPYINGRVHGVEIDYKWGKNHKKRTYVKGVIVGSVLEFDRKGNVVGETIYKYGSVDTIIEKGKQVWTASRNL